MIHHDFATLLLAWYDKNKRILPWRDTNNPYHTWLSEIMLQQTRVEAVKVYFTNFIAKLPDIKSLALADEDIYLKLWEGLGYYSRVRNLHKAAIEIMDNYGGNMPSTYNELLRLPGIGPYTAAAIASICFQEKTPAIDGNLLRVFARLTSYPQSIKDERAKKLAYAFFLEYMPSRAGDFNQALMDLGAGICLPNGKPLCHTCPVEAFCRSHKTGTENDFPVIPKKKERSIEKKTIFLIHDDIKIALRKRSTKGLLAGMYEFPNVEGHLNKKMALEYIKELGFTPLHIKKLEASRHIFSHKEWDMICYEVFTSALEPFIIKEECLAYADEISASSIFLSDISQIKDIYSIPSAFKVYKDYLLNS